MSRAPTSDRARRRGGGTARAGAAGPAPAPGGATTAAGGLPARIAALTLLRAVLSRRRPLDEALEETGPHGAGLERLTERDRAFARLLTATVLRRLGSLDALLDRALDKPAARHATPVRDVLRLGCAQLLLLDTPPHAAVGTSVALLERSGPAGLKGLINAVLRRLARDGRPWLESLDADRLDTPDWLWDRWVAAYGEPSTRAIAAAHRAEPPLDLTVNRHPGAIERLRDAVDGDGWPPSRPSPTARAGAGDDTLDATTALAEALEAETLPTGTLRRACHGAVTSLPGYDQGLWWVQDAAAALPTRLLGDIAGRRVYDLCAAPGGKTAQLAAAGARVTAVDRSAPRLRRLTQNLMRLGLAAEAVVADAAGWRPPEPAPFVLLDAPCTSTGAIRRHPDVARLKTPEDVARLAAVQARLLDHAISLVAPGGRLVWCTCSLEPEEGERQIERLLGSGAPVVRDPIDTGEVGGLNGIVTKDGDLRTLPCHLADRGGLDGFHVARLRRIG